MAGLLTLSFPSLPCGMATSVQQPRMIACRHMLIYGECRARFLAASVNLVSRKFFLGLRMSSLRRSRRFCILPGFSVLPHLFHKNMKHWSFADLLTEKVALSDKSLLMDTKDLYSGWASSGLSSSGMLMSDLPPLERSGMALQ